jgi:uncharacterized protein YndB with AHSA1/START domain
MTDAFTNPYGVLTEDATLNIQRLLPGPIERVWAYLTESDLRRQWLASGPMDLKAGGAMALTWRNDELTQPPGQRPEGFDEEQRMEGRIIDIDPPRKLTFTWSGTGDVTIELQPLDDKVLLKVTHRRIPERSVQLMVGAGWHMHLDILAARISNSKTEPFWDGWSRLREEYEQLLPA